MILYGVKIDEPKVNKGIMSTECRHYTEEITFFDKDGLENFHSKIAYLIGDIEADSEDTYVTLLAKLSEKYPEEFV